MYLLFAKSSDGNAPLFEATSEAMFYVTPVLKFIQNGYCFLSHNVQLHCVLGLCVCPWGLSVTLGSQCVLGA